ncbi:peroxiredoxin-like family protein [Phenylobacterium sp. LjRoot225]|uniref:peroxiredoxin-like family protein n=1 Tax=Phenylobacterium sp. LjRoot225 TaxID=3342285 RepID=UPI003ED16F85
MSTISLRQLLAELHAERERTWEPAQLQLNINQRLDLVEAAKTARWVKAGDPAPAFELEEVDGERLTLEGLTAKGPAVLILFRFAGCPACNIALPYYSRALAPHLAALGVPLVAASPQIPERLVEIKRRHDLKFQVATDRDNVLGRKLGVLYTANAATQAAAQAKGTFIGDTIGTGTWEIPQATALVIGTDRRIKFADVSPDWLVRTEAGPILEAVREALAVPAE